MWVKHCLSNTLTKTFRMSGLWGPQSSLDLYLQEEGIKTLFMTGVNADQVSFQTPKILKSLDKRHKAMMYRRMGPREIPF